MIKTGLRDDMCESCTQRYRDSKGHERCGYDNRHLGGYTTWCIAREGGDEKASYILPEPSMVIQKGDTLILFGLQEDLSRFPIR